MPNVGEDKDFAREQAAWRLSDGKKEIATFASAGYLDNDGVIVAYLTAALQNADSKEFIMALANVAKARDVATIASSARPVLQKTLAPRAKPSFETVHKLVNALGLRWAIVPHASSSVTEIRERLASRPAVTTRATAAETLRRERNRR